MAALETPPRIRELEQLSNAQPLRAFLEVASHSPNPSLRLNHRSDEIIEIGSIVPSCASPDRFVLMLSRD
ncbi:hypothetical protein EKH55_5949 (plasmid) [Sinorhizobium alkalisoli]|nr:hypothetical protein EKH55_5949 [Sinorhizobium alkalisoli]